MEGRAPNKLFKIILFGSKKNVVDTFMSNLSLMSNLLSKHFDTKTISTAPDVISLYLNKDNSDNTFQFYYISTVRDTPAAVLNRNTIYFANATACIITDPSNMQENVKEAIAHHCQDLGIPIIDGQHTTYKDILQNITAFSEGAHLMVSDKEWVISSEEDPASVEINYDEWELVENKNKKTRGVESSLEANNEKEAIAESSPISNEQEKIHDLKDWEFIEPSIESISSSAVYTPSRSEFSGLFSRKKTETNDQNLELTSIRGEDKEESEQRQPLASLRQQEEKKEKKRGFFSDKWDQLKQKTSLQNQNKGKKNREKIAIKLDIFDSKNNKDSDSDSDNDNKNQSTHTRPKKGGGGSGK